MTDTSQLELETWWAELYRSNGAAYAQRLRSSERVSSDPSLRKRINSEAFKLMKRAQVELMPRGGNVSINVSYLLKLLESMEGLALAHLVISAALNHLLGSSNHDTTLAAVGGSIVRAVEIELRIRFIEMVHPKLAARWASASGTFTHRNKALMAVAGRGSRAGLPRFFESIDTRNQLAMALGEMLLLAHGMFEPYLATRGDRSRIWCVRVKSDVVDAFNRTTSLDEFLSCVPPLGLYLEPQPSSRDVDMYLLARRPLVSHNWLSGQKPSNPVPELVDSCIRRLNGVGYRVNTAMLDWIKTHETQLASRGIITPMVFRIREGDDRAAVYKTWNKSETKRRLHRRTLMLAEKLRDNVFYHDWFIDFRGRMYTTSSLLSPQGTPLNKSLICFDETVEINPKVYDAAYTEFIDYGSRMLLGKAAPKKPSLHMMIDVIHAAVEGTLDPTILNDSKDYLPFVAWSLEACRVFQGQGQPIRTGIMLRRDATASSIQHMATMAKDRHLMRLVNLRDTPPTNVSDLYSGLNIGSLNRPAIKSFIMTYCYNSTAYGRARERIARGEGTSLKGFMAEDRVVQDTLAPLLGNVASVRDALGSIGESLNWTFTSPSGIVWDGVKYEWPTKRILVRYNSAKIRVRLRTTSGTPERNLRSTASAYVANVVHSLDASMLHLCVNEWPNSVAFIHDCVVTLPGRMDVTCNALRASFFRMHETLEKKFNWGVAESINLDYDKYIRNSRYMFI